MEVQHKIVMSQVMLPHQANVAGNVHGGEIMKFMDMAAAAVAMKFSKGNCVTARVDELLFHLPIFVGALVTCTASLVYVGRTSMEVLVRVESEDLESHSGPEKALSDGPNSWPLDRMESLLKTLVALDRLVKGAGFEEMR